MTDRRNVLGSFLEALVRRYASADYLDSDPLGLVVSYEDPLDVELVGLVAAALAYGNARAARASARRVLEVLGPRPARGARELGAEGIAQALDGWWVHRFHRPVHVAALCAAAAAVQREYGSLGAAFEACDQDWSFPDLSGAGGTRKPTADLAPALSRWVSLLGAAARVHVQTEDYAAGLRWLLADPARGSACKRMWMYLRWMVRREAPDLGLWRGLDPARLLVPLDTHVARISRQLGLTARRTANLAMAREVTAALRKLCPSDPVRYDWALSRLGILRHCPAQPTLRHCGTCELWPVCTVRKDR